jgi:tetratricopeptide (TPR) repeat protein
MWNRIGRAATVLVVLVVVTASTTTGASPTDASKARAKEAFDAGKKLFADEKYADACAKFAESEGLDPGFGVAFNLGACYEKLGSARQSEAAFRRAVKLATDAGQADKAKDAQARADAAATQVIHVKLTVPKSIQALPVGLDGHRIAPEDFGTQIAIDAGDHVVTVTGIDKCFETSHFKATLPGRVYEVVLHEQGLRESSPHGDLTPPPKPFDLLGGTPGPAASSSSSAAAAPSAPPFDKAAAAAALKTIKYEDCGTGGVGTVRVTFDATGAATSVRASRGGGAYDAATAACLQERFMTAKVPPFGDAPQSSMRVVTLPSSK